MVKKYFGIGINDADYSTQTTERVMVAGWWRHVRAWVCPFYDKWVNMLARCYSDKVKENNQTYKGCTVCEE